MKSIKLLCRCIFIFLVIIQYGCSDSPDNGRPEALLLDEAEILGEIEESIERTLNHLRDDYQVEVVLATVTSSGNNETLREMTARLFTEWDVGRTHEGRGLLVLLDGEEKEVRIEVGLALEGIFTDLFTGYIENKQLKPYYLSDQLEIGLLAILEEIEARANLMSRDEASSETINSRDLKFLSSGGGADVDLKGYVAETVIPGKGGYPAGHTPDQAWQILLQSWRDKNRDPDVGIYTPVTRLIYRSYTSQPDRRFEEDVRTWGDKPYEVIKDDNYAVIFFGSIKGWENAPFLLCRTGEGWQFDMVHQRKIIRMGRAPLWGIERGEHPYIGLLSRCPFWMGQDMPLQDHEIYHVQNDKESVLAILMFEEELGKNENDLETLVELGKLYTRTSMNQKRITLLTKANTLAPDHPEAIRALAIAHVDAHYQYSSALRLIDKYVVLLPQDANGHFFRGYLLLMEDRHSDAVDSFEKGLQLEPENVYGLCKLARAYHARGKKGDRDLARAVLDKLVTTHPDHIRVSWLKGMFQ